MASKKSRYPNRYVVFHSSFGEAFFDTLAEAREFAKDFERRCWNAGYAACIYDTLKGKAVA